MNNTVVIDGELDLIAQIDAELTLEDNTEELGDFIVLRDLVYPAYDGQTEVTPSDHTMILTTSNKTLFNDITINPIPSNYGRIEWNGSTLTVS